MKVERASVVPLYRQLASTLRHEIESGKFKPGAPLPPESELTRKFHISRITVRQALHLIASEGLIERKQGKGTFVRTPKIQQNLDTLQGFAELMEAHGHDQAMHVVAMGQVPADARVAQVLHLQKGQSVVRILRRHLLKDNPIAYAVIYLPWQLGQLFTAEQVSTTPIYTLLTLNAHVEIKRATQIIRALVADPETASLLGVRKGAPVMMIERTTYSSDEMPVEYILLFYRGDSYELAVELHRDPIRNMLWTVASDQWMMVSRQ